MFLEKNKEIDKINSFWKEKFSLSKNELYSILTNNLDHLNDICIKLWRTKFNKENSHFEYCWFPDSDEYPDQSINFQKRDSTWSLIFNLYIYPLRKSIQIHQFRLPEHEQGKWKLTQLYYNLTRIAKHEAYDTLHNTSTEWFSLKAQAWLGLQINTTELWSNWKKRWWSLWWDELSWKIVNRYEELKKLALIDWNNNIYEIINNLKNSHDPKELWNIVDLKNEITFQDDKINAHLDSLLQERIILFSEQKEQKKQIINNYIQSLLEKLAKWQKLNLWTYLTYWFDARWKIDLMDSDTIQRMNEKFEKKKIKKLI